MAREPQAPSWVTEWYPNDPVGLRLAIVRFNTPVTTAAERARAKAYRPEGKSFPCADCGRFAFPYSRICFWCAKEQSHGRRID